METHLFWLVPAASLLALILAGYFYKQMMRESEGTDTMKRIASHVRKGAMSYLKQQYKVAGTFPATNNAWLYIKDMIVDPVSGYMVPKSFGGGDKTYWADGYYTGENPAVGAETARELLLRGNLSGGGIAGPAYVHAGSGVSNQWWDFLGTLSPNAVRGEWR